MLTDKHVTEWKQRALEVIAEMHDALNERAVRLAVAVLVISRDRDAWRVYAERLAHCALEVTPRA